MPNPRPLSDVHRFAPQVRDLIMGEGLSRRAAAKRLDLTENQVHYLCGTYRILSRTRPNTPPVKVTDKLIDQVSTLVADKLYTRKQAAEALGLTPNQIRGICQRFKISSGVMGRPPGTGRVRPSAPQPQPPMPTPVRAARIPTVQPCWHHDHLPQYDLEDTGEL